MGRKVGQELRMLSASPGPPLVSGGIARLGIGPLEPRHAAGRESAFLIDVPHDGNHAVLFT